jgi:hypothetical protein
LHYSNRFKGINRLRFSVSELLWAAITVGRANMIDVLSNGVYSEYEILYRTAIVIANVSQQGNNLMKSPAYENLDPSEKSAVSYFLGLTFSKLMSQRLLNIPWLLHLDVYRRQFLRQGVPFIFGSTRSRPDLIGQDRNNNWIIIESKGRTNYMESTLLQKAKNQSRSLRRIGGVSPILRIGMVTHFQNKELIVDWVDPENHNANYFDIDTNSDEFLINYYQLIYSILQNKNYSKNGEYVTYTFDSIDLTIGLHEKIFNNYSSNSLKNVIVGLDLPQYPSISMEQESEQIPQFLEDENIREEKYFDKKIVTPEQFQGKEGNETYLGGDGIIISVGTNWEKMMLENKKF